MEAEERPSKVRKLDASDDDEAIVSSLQPVSNPALSAASKPSLDATNDTTTPVVELDKRYCDTDSESEAEGHVTELLEPMSKNQMKKLRRKEAWEAGRDYRKAKRKEKTQAKKARKRAEREEQVQIQRENSEHGKIKSRVPRPRRPMRLPVTIIVDCGFDKLMVDKERISLGSQLTRAYSDVHKAPYQSHLYISSWSGLLKERFDTILSGNYRNWKDIIFTEQDFVGAAEQARQGMRGKRGGKMVGAFEKYAAVSLEESLEKSAPTSSVSGSTSEAVQANGDSSEESNLDEPARDIIYLTSESPYTLTSLDPHHIYVVGGLVDKNRHKGICYKTACDRKIRTAKLPIGEYMDMTSRFVLATNHVVEIMLKWLEFGDWAQAFMEVMPKRKGGKLKTADTPEKYLSGNRSDDVDESASDGERQANSSAIGTDNEVDDAVKVNGSVDKEVIVNE